MARTLRNEAAGRPTADRQRSSDVGSLSERRSRKGAEGSAPAPAPDAPEADVPTGDAKDRPAGAGGGGGHDGRAVVTLSPAVASATRRMGEQMGGVGTTEVVRRGLILLDLLLNLDDDEELVVRDANTKQVDRLRFAWDTF
jgi:hypothetical protein